MSKVIIKNINKKIKPYYIIKIQFYDEEASWSSFKFDKDLVDENFAEFMNFIKYLYVSYYTRERYTDNDCFYDKQIYPYCNRICENRIDELGKCKECNKRGLRCSDHHNTDKTHELSKFTYYHAVDRKGNRSNLGGIKFYFVNETSFKMKAYLKFAQNDVKEIVGKIEENKYRGRAINKPFNKHDPTEFINAVRTIRDTMTN